MAIETYRDFIGNDQAPLAWWESEAERLVVEALRGADSSLKSELAEHAEYVRDWLRGSIGDRIDALATTHFPAMAKTRPSQIRKEYPPEMRHQVRMACTCCVQPPRVSLVDPDTDEALPPDHEQSRRLAQMLDPLVTNWEDRVWQAERWLRAHGTVLLYAAWRRDRLRFDVLCPGQFDYVESVDEPADLSRARAILVTSAVPGYGRTTATQTQYTVWTRLDAPNGGLVWGCHVVDAYGRLQPNPLWADNLNHYGRHPCVAWYEEEPATDGIQESPDVTLLKYCENVAIKLMQLDMDEAYGSRGRAYIAGDDALAEQNQLDAAPDAVWRLYGSTTAGVLGAPSDPTRAIEAVTGYVRNHLRMSGLPTYLADSRTPSIQTGAAVFASRADVHDIRIARAPMMRRNLIRTLDIGRAVWNQWLPAQAIDTRYKWRVDFWAQELNGVAPERAADAAETARRAESQARQDPDSVPFAEPEPEPEV